jgi:hypothetical protein
LRATRPPGRKFKSYPSGYFHIDIAEVRTEQGKLYMLVAINRTSKFAFVELHEGATTMVAADFLRHLIAAVPYKVHTVLTDNGIHVTDPKYPGSAVEEVKLALAASEIFRCHFFASGCGRQRALTHQPTPGEDLTSADAVLAGDKRHAHPRQIRLFDDPDLLLGCPSPPALNTRKDLAIIVTPGRTVSHMPHSYLRARSCQVI